MTSDKQTVDAIHAWIREETPLSVKMAMTPELVDALSRRLAAPASPSLGERGVDEILDAASAYMKETYGIGALSHPTDRARVLALLSRPEGE